MKHLKFLMVAFTLMMGLSLTSCLDSGSGESSYDGAGYARVQPGFMGGHYFVDLLGNKYFPTESSVAMMKANFGFDITTSDLVFIYFKNVDTTTGAKETTPSGDRTIELVSVAAIDSYRAKQVPTQDALETSSVENAPIVTLEPRNNYGEASSPALYGAEMIILPVSWKMENKTETLKQHTFTLVAVNEEVESDGSELVLYLRHNKGTDTKTETTATLLKAFDIKEILSRMKSKNGEYPAKITVKAKAAIDNTTNLPKDYTDYSIDTSALNKKS